MYLKLKNKIEKKHIVMFFIVLICIATTPIFTNRVYLGNDSLFHYARIKELATALKNGVLYPTLYSNMLGGQGYASSLFYPDIFLMIPAVFTLIGLDVYDSLSLFIFLLNVATFFISYYSLRCFLKDKKELKRSNYMAVLGAAAYIIYPYRIINIIMRGAVSEVIAMTFIPIIVLSYYKIFIKKEYKYWKMLSLGFTLIVLSHLVSTLIIAIVGVIFFLFNTKVLKDKEFYKSILKAVSLALLLTSYFLIPMIEQMLSGEYLYNLLPTITDYTLNPNKTIDLNVKRIINLDLNQYILLIINAVYIYAAVKTVKKLYSKYKLKQIYLYLIASVLVFIYVFILTTNLFPWVIVKTIFPIIQQVQFPFRFHMISGIPFAILICLSWSSKKETKKSISVKLIILMIMGYLMINIFGYREPLSDERDYINNHPDVKNSWTLIFGEFLPSSIENIRYKENLKKEVDDKDTITTTIFTDKTLGKIYSKKEFNKLFIDLKNISIKEDIANYNLSTELIYYKGYKAYVDGKEISISQDEKGRIKILNIPSSSKNLVIEYIGTPIQKTSRIVSILSLCCLIICPKIKLNKKLV